MKKEELLQKMETSIEELIGDIEQVSEEEFEQQPITGTWAAKEILSHVAAWDVVYVELSKKLLKNGLLPKLPDFDTFNRGEVAKRSRLTREEIINEVRKNRKAYTEFLAGLTEEQLQEVKYNLSVEQLATNIMSHDRYHLQQIRARIRK